jgi:hypothetical protein
MATTYKKGKSFAVAYRLKDGPRQYIYGIKTERLALRAKLKKDEEEQLSRAGLHRADPHAEQLTAAGRKPLSEHIEGFERNILARGKGPRYAGQQAAHVRRLFSIAKVTSVGRIAVEPVQQALKRLGESGCGPRTCNAARQAAIQFERYLKRQGGIREAVLHDLARFNEGADVRRKRRPLTPFEVDRLLATTERGRDRTSRRCGISPADRAILYATAIGTGYRKRALLSLQKSSFVVLVETVRPFVRLAAAHNKNGKDRDQVIPRDLADRLRVWLAGRPDTGSVWHPSPHADLALWFRRDMETARAAWIAEASSEAEREEREKSNVLRYVYHDGVRYVYADFHSLRHTGITFAVRRAGIRIGQAWADHSTPVLTARYADVDQEDLQKAVDGLPRLGRDSASLKESAATRDDRERQR